MQNFWTLIHRNPWYSHVFMLITGLQYVNIQKFCITYVLNKPLLSLATGIFKSLLYIDDRGFLQKTPS